MTLVAFLAGCLSRQGLKETPAPIAPAEVRLRNCTGPATSLPAHLAAKLAPRTGAMHPDDQWADLAEHVPGGFAGILYRAGKPVLRLTDTTQAEAAKRALVGVHPSFPIGDATVEASRWNFAQLVNWYNYLMQHTPLWSIGVTSGDKSEGDNRIKYGVADSASLRRVRDLLISLPIPCDLVLLEIREPIRLHDDPTPTTRSPDVV
jgi:hypothetical protein